MLMLKIKNATRKMFEKICVEKTKNLQERFCYLETVTRHKKLFKDVVSETVEKMMNIICKVYIKREL